MRRITQSVRSQDKHILLVSRFALTRNISYSTIATARASEPKLQCLQTNILVLLLRMRIRCLGSSQGVLEGLRLFDVAMYKDYSGMTLVVRS